jgi:hypothetical protein
LAAEAELQFNPGYNRTQKDQIKIDTGIVQKKKRYKHDSERCSNSAISSG